MEDKRNFKAFWAERRKKAEDMRAKGGCLIMINGAARGGRIHLIAPAHVSLAARAREIGGRWRPASSVWSFRRESLDLVVKFCKQLYGAGKVLVREQ